MVEANDVFAPHPDLDGVWGNTLCTRCGGARMFRPVGAQTHVLMCQRCDEPDRFAQVELVDRDRGTQRPCQVCGRASAVWGPGLAACAEHWSG
jgi:hypothetical protein